MKPFSEFFGISRDARAELLHHDNTSIMIVDGFLADPDAVLALAQSLDYGIIRGPREYRAYPGERAVISHNPTPLYEAVLEMYRKALIVSDMFKTDDINGKTDDINEGQGRDTTNTQKLSDARRAHSSASCHSFETKAYAPHPVMFTKMNAQAISKLHPRQKTPHIDADAALSGLIYLTPDSDCTGGTGFYRHRQTGIGHFPPAPNAHIANLMRQGGYDPLSASDYENFQFSVIRSDIEYIGTLNCTGLDHETNSWEAPQVVQMKFNRLVLFPATLIHSPIYQPENDANDRVARITQNFFFRTL